MTEQRKERVRNICQGIVAEHFALMHNPSYRHKDFSWKDFPATCGALCYFLIRSHINATPEVQSYANQFAGSYATFLVTRMTEDLPDGELRGKCDNMATSLKALFPKMAFTVDTALYAQQSHTTTMKGNDGLPQTMIIDPERIEKKWVVRVDASSLGYNMPLHIPQDMDLDDAVNMVRERFGETPRK